MNRACKNKITHKAIIIFKRLTFVPSKIKFLLLFSIINLFVFSQTDINCYTIAVGKSVSMTGSVLIAHNEDDYGNLIVNLYKVPAKNQSDISYKLINGFEIPQVSRTNSYIWFETTQENFGDFFVNEFGVTICSNACKSKEENAQGEIGYDLRKIVAQRASSARQAVEIAGELVEKYGYTSSGRTYCFADAWEIWLMDIVKGKHWVAQRVPDDKVAIVPNYYTIEEIDLSDSNNFLGSKDIIDYAIKQNWYNPDEAKPFNFKTAYSATLNLYGIWNIFRHWSGINFLSNNKYSLYADYPFAFSPKNKVNIKMLQNVLSSHYEGTEFETCKNLKTNPHQSSINRICNSGTKFSVVVELHNTYPENNQNVIWFAPFNPCVNAYIPIACAIDSFPSVYQNRKLEDAMEYHFDKNSNTFEANPKHAFSVFYFRNSKINDDYWNKSVDAKKLKKEFEQKAIKQFNKNKSGKTSYKLLMDYYSIMN